MIRNVIFDWSGTLVDDLPAVWKASNYVLAQAGRAEMSLEQFRALGDPRGMAATLLLLGEVSLHRRDFAVAQVLLEEALDHCRQAGWTQGSTLALAHLGRVAMRQDDPSRAQSLLEQGLALAEAEAAGDAATLALSLHHLGDLAFETGDDAHAGAPLTRSLEISRRLGHQYVTSSTLRCLADIARWPDRSRPSRPPRLSP